MQQELLHTVYILEATAAEKAGLQSMIVRRPGNAVLTIAQMKQFATINSFEEIMFDEVASKKKKI